MRRAISFMVGLTSIFFLVSCGGGGGGQQITVAIDPTSTIVTVSQVTPFKDTVTGTTNTAVNWEVNGVVGGTASTGTISASGAYTAPAQVPNPARVTVTVVLQADATKSASAAVTIVSHTPNEAAQSLPIILGTTGGNAKDSSTSGNTITCCGGALGSLVQRKRGFYVLSNNHVLARSDLAAIGDYHTQPWLAHSDCYPNRGTVLGHRSHVGKLQTSGA